MKKTLTQTLEIPVQYTPDVLVVGGGFAGIAAALSAARMGKKTMLIEKSYYLGAPGNQTLNISGPHAHL